MASVVVVTITRNLSLDAGVVEGTLESAGEGGDLFGAPIIPEFVIFKYGREAHHLVDLSQVLLPTPLALSLFF